MSPVQYGLRNYRNHDTANKPLQSSHPLDVLSSILFDIKTENRQRESNSQSRENTTKESREEFNEILKRELSK